MIVNFSDIKFDTYGNIEDPTIILKNLDETVICTLGNYYNLKLNLKFNNISEVTFDIPAHFIEDGNTIKTPFYSHISGMKLVEIEPFGNFILSKPKTKGDGIKEIKSCTAYSLEYEFNNKNIYLPSGTYNFYNPVDIDNTVIGNIKKLMPHWNIGTISSSLVGKYRTFEVNNQKLYGFMMNDIQKTYNCVFIFDTYTRTFHVRDANETVVNSPIFLSYDNLIKEVEIEEQTDNLVTVLSAYGADPVTIRNVNPIGTNKIYNLDYFIQTGSLSNIITEKWNLWKTNFQLQQPIYNTLSTFYNMEVANLITEQANLTTLNNQLKVLETTQKAIAKAIAEGSSNQSALDDVNEQIRDKESEISQQEDKITIIQNRINDYKAQKVAINNTCSFNTYFTEDEINKLQSYFKEETLQDSSFVVSSVDSYDSSNVANSITNGVLYIENADITEVQVDSQLNKRIFDVKSGIIRVNGNEFNLNADIVRLTLELRLDSNEYILSSFTNHSTINSITYNGASITSKGIISGFSFNDDINFNIDNGTVYITKEVTEYQQQTVEQDLYNYAVKTLNDMAFPSFVFSIDSANLLFLKEFEPFKDKLTLGNSITLALDDEKIIYPILLEVSLDYESKNSFSLKFSDTYSLNDPAFKNADLLKQAITMGSTVDFNKYNYSKFLDSGASTQINSFMNSALDVSKNAILSGARQGIGWDESGFHLRQWNETKTAYLPEQISMINNGIVFTDDAWNTAKMAIGKFVDKNLGTQWGIVAPMLAGTFIAGKNAMIENISPEGKNVQFRVDGTGVYLNNSRFLTSYGNTQIAIDPSIGIAIGVNPLYSVDSNTNELILNEGSAKFYADANGNLTLKGTVYAVDGEFTGDVTARNFFFQDGSNIRTLLSQSQKKIPSDFLDVYGLNVINKLTGDTTLSIDNNGNINMYNGSINWNNVNSDPKIQEATNDIDALARGEYTKAGKTFINGNYIYSPNIQAGKFYGAKYYDTNGIGELSLSDGYYSDLVFRNMRNTPYELFKIRDEGTGTIVLMIAGVQALIGNLATNTVSIAPNVKIPYKFA